MRARRRMLVALLVYGTATQAVYPPSLAGKDLFQSVFKMRKPEQRSDPYVEQLAEEIDWLEKHIDNYGSVVAKQPDVWGQARLTKHRQEYEHYLALELDKFKDTINGTLARSDQAYLASAMALSAAVSGRQAGLIPPTEGTAIPVPTTTVNNLLPGLAGATGEKGQEPSAAATNLFQSPPITVKVDRFAAFNDNAKISLEPTEHLDQLSRYLQHLHQLRRINEGDDTADSPGYALYLVRVPVSVLPGRTTRKGYGAEITITAEPYLSEALLPTTFRSLVINDLVDQLALPITKIADAMTWRGNESAFREYDAALADLCKDRAAVARYDFKGKHSPVATYEEHTPAGALYAILKESAGDDQPPLTPFQTLATKSADINRQLSRIAPLLLKGTATASDRDAMQRMLHELRDLEEEESKSLPAAAQLDATTLSRLSPALENIVRDGADAQKPSTQRSVYSRVVRSAQNPVERCLSLYDNSDRERVAQQRIASAARKLAAAIVAPAGRTRRALHAIPPTQVVDVFGATELVAIARRFHGSYQGPNTRWRGTENDRVHLLDVKAYLQAEIDAAYELLARPESAELWQNVAVCDQSRNFSLADAVRENNLTAVQCGRNQFFATRTGAGSTKGNCDKDVCQEMATVDVLAWAIVVESALLNDHLVQDMVHAAQAKGCNCAGAADLQFYLPSPSPDACEAFNEYVRCRWPIHVFALDPVNQEQNIADAFSRRRELQLALSLGFVSGQINAQSLTRFARRLETDMETIALNRTVVGYSHGDDTFGWRFYPRFQSPPTPGTIRAFGETLFGGPRPDQDLLQRQIEPGMRECVAIVIMPSFVPYVTLDVHSNWFRLNERHGWLPTRHQTEISTVDAVKLSRSIQSMHESVACVQNPQFYRDGEIERLLKRVHQLDRQLPLQTMRTQVPIENTLGGFEMFSNGITDLAPELHGWYGGPGVALSAADGTTLFLVGDHFSVHETKVIAGHREVTAVKMLSRQVLEATIPPNIEQNFVENEPYVDVHVATPYGVTAHLHVPVVAAAAKPATGISVAADALGARVAFDPLCGKVKCLCFTDPPDEFTVIDPSSEPLHPRQALLAIGVNAVSKDGKSTPLGEMRLAKPTEFKKRKATVKFSDLTPQIDSFIRENLRDDHHAEKLVMDVYLNFDQPDGAGLPVVRAENSLEVILTTLSPDVCHDADCQKQTSSQGQKAASGEDKDDRADSPSPRDSSQLRRRSRYDVQPAVYRLPPVQDD